MSLKSKEIIIKSKLRDYSVFFPSDASFINDLIATSNSILLVDEGVWEAHKDELLKNVPKSEYYIVPISEEKKTLDSVQSLYDILINRAVKKNLTIIAIGGGIMQDISGYVASTLYRGVNWIFIPTTLLSQVDSCIGGKTSLNYKQYKNLIGTFYPPFKIFVFPQFLKTQHNLEYFSGLGEVVKLHIIGGEKLIDDIQRNIEDLKVRDETVLRKIIRDCLMIKKEIIENDEFDKGRRNILNYGHCFGHAIESASNYVIPHGQAILLGIMLANKVAVERGILSQEYEKFLREKILMPVKQEYVGIEKIDNKKIIENMKMDKKRTGKELALITIRNGPEMVQLNDLSENEAIKILNIYKEYENRKNT